jgi:hypothetical protein
VTVVTSQEAQAQVVVEIHPPKAVVALVSQQGMEVEMVETVPWVNAVCSTWAVLG